MVLAFGLPLALMATRSPAVPDPMAGAAQRSHGIAAVLAATTDPGAVQRAIEATESGADSGAGGAAGRIAVHGLAGGPVGHPHASADAISEVSDRAGTATVQGGASYLEPVAFGRGKVAVVEVFVPAAELAAARPPRQTGGAWWLLLAAGVVAVAGTILATDRVARRVAGTATSIADAALALGDGDVEARVAVRGTREIAGAALSFNAMANRVAEQRAAERELIADLSHRLRTPLTALRLEAERVRGLSGVTRLSQAVEAMEREVDHLIHTARQHTPAPPTEPDQCDAGEVVRERMAFWSAVAEDQSRAFKVSGTERAAPVQIPRTDLAAALDALLGNVFRYTPQGTAFEVAVTRRDGFVAVRVDDAGPGISHPGRALRRGLSERGSTGLGLDIVRRAAVAGRGSVDVDRAAIGGASVVVLLADADPAAQPVRQRLGFVGRLSREPDERRWGRRARAARGTPPSS